MRSAAQLSRTPYVIMVVMRTGTGAPPPEVVSRRRHLSAAMSWVRDMSKAWTRLVGGLAPVLYWYVIDERDGTEHHLSTYSGGFIRHGQQTARKVTGIN